MTTANATGPLVVMTTPVIEGIPSVSPTDVGIADGAASDMLHQERMEYIKQLVQERERLSNGVGCEVAKKLIEQELERVQNGKKSEEKRTLEVTKEKSIKVTVKVLVPVREHPKFNFVGKLLGPKGNSLKRLQEETMTKMAILGRGSFRDKAKEEELRKNPDPKYGHLHEELHVEVTAHAPPAEAYARIAYALTEIRRYLVPDHNDEIRQEQMREMQILNGRPAILGAEGGDTHTDTSGSLSPPNSLSPPPTAPVKLPTHTIPTAHPAQPTMTPTIITHPALRGLMPSIAAPTVATTTMIGRFPTLFPIGSVPTITPQPPRSMWKFLEFAKGSEGSESFGSLPLYEEYATEITAAMTQPEYDPSLLNGTADDKKDGLKVGSPLQRGRYRHDPYRRVTINVPS
ncbi:UNVERIFIED_CONTAM: hypothetical protein RMT77_002105 [Armadillidium vulgare]